MRKQPTVPLKEEVLKKEEVKTDNKKTATSKDVKLPQSIKQQKKPILKQEAEIKEDKKNSKKPGKAEKTEVKPKQPEQKKKEDKPKITKQQVKDAKGKISKSIQPPVKEPTKQQSKKQDISKKGVNKSIVSESKEKSKADISKNKKQPQHPINTPAANPIAGSPVINSKQSKQKGDIIQSSGLLRAYQTFLKSLCKHGLPTGDVFQFAAQHLEKFEKKKIAKDLKQKAEAQIRKKARFHREQQIQENQDNGQGE